MKSWLPARELKKGSAELLVLALVEDQPRHGYDIGKLIVARSKGDARRRRFYRLTPLGRKVLAAQRGGWKAFVRAINRIARVET